MPDQGTDNFIQIKDGDWENLNRALRLIYNQLDAITGRRGVGSSPTQRYTPKHTNFVNLDSTGPQEANYLRVLDTVIVFGQYSAKPTATTTSTSFEMSLPIEPKFKNEFQGAGMAFAPGVAGQGAGIVANMISQNAKVEWESIDVTDQAWTFMFAYGVN